jgi:hypothetical protein
MRNLQFSQRGVGEFDLVGIDRMIRPDCGAAEKSGQYHIAADSFAGDRKHQVVGDDSHVLAQFEDVPAFAAEQSHPRIFPSNGIAFARNRLDQRRLAAAVRPKNRDVLVGSDAQAEVVKRDLLPAHHAQVMKVQQQRFLDCHAHRNTCI